jgi:hypothetical protein
VFATPGSVLAVELLPPQAVSETIMLATSPHDKILFPNLFFLFIVNILPSLSFYAF